MKKRYLILLILSLVFFGCSKKQESIEIDSKEEQELKIKYVEDISTYLKSVTYSINEEARYNYASTDTILFVPVGDKISCVEDIIESPFKSEWVYAYIAVWFDGEEYMYYTAALDKAGYGINFRTRLDLYTDDEQQVTKDVKEIKEFTDNYKKDLNGNKIYSINDISEDFKKIIDDNFKDINNIVFIESKDCMY